MHHAHHIHNSSRATVPAVPLQRPVRQDTPRCTSIPAGRSPHVLDLSRVLLATFPEHVEAPEVIAHAGLRLYPRADRHNDAAWERELADTWLESTRRNVPSLRNTDTAMKPKNEQPTSTVDIVRVPKGCTPAPVIITEADLEKIV